MMTLFLQGPVLKFTIEHDNPPQSETDPSLRHFATIEFGHYQFEYSSEFSLAKSAMNEDQGSKSDSSSSYKHHHHLFQTISWLTPSRLEMKIPLNLNHSDTLQDIRISLADHNKGLYRPPRFFS